MFYYYKYKGKYLFSPYKYKNLEPISEEEIKTQDNRIFFLNKLEPLKSRRSFLVNHPSLLFNKEEDVSLLLLDNMDYSQKLPQWIMDKINEKKLVAINSQYPNWEEALDCSFKKEWRVNILALGDVGSTLAIGLRLLGGDAIDCIGIYDRNPKRLQRWEYELNQIRKPFKERAYPPVEIISKDQLFNCHMFIFCASKGIPPVGSGIRDVRMAQFNGNSEIIKEYALLARERDFKGIFAVVSDPVDLLCKVALLESNKGEKGQIDFKGLAPEQIIGYGLGVMNGRAAYYAEKSPKTYHYLDEGRAFGPHGKGLIIADSVENYNEDLSDYLTEKTLNANLAVRELGYKPYIAPSLSSGALSIIATIKGDWFYGSTYMGEAYFGSRCRLYESYLEIEKLPIPKPLWKKINKSYKELGSII